MDLLRVAGDKSVCGYNPGEFIRLQNGIDEMGLRNNGLVWRKTNGGHESITIFLIGTRLILRNAESIITDGKVEKRRTHRTCNWETQSVALEARILNGRFTSSARDWKLLLSISDLSLLILLLLLFFTSEI